ncbi:MAG TPA: hypothetical protein PKN33_07885 [Phycisphaerae bacterium]|nr:hypothetical protein [Phycisphaerae bacterium]
MKEHVIDVNGVEVIEAPNRRNENSNTENAEGLGRSTQLLSLLLHIFIALLRTIIAVSIAIGQVLGSALRQARQALADKGASHGADSKGRESNAA